MVFLLLCLAYFILFILPPPIYENHTKIDPKNLSTAPELQTAPNLTIIFKSLAASSLRIGLSVIPVIWNKELQVKAH